MKLSTLVLIVLIAGVSYVAGQAPAEQQATMAAPDPGATDAVYEAVIRYQIATWKLGAETYCIQINGQDAEGKLLRSLKPLPVRAASECHEVKKKYDTLVTEKHSKKQSVIFGASTIRWTSETTADVEGGYLCGSQCMSGGVYHVVKEGGQWKAVKFDKYISN
jgi:hypothetical protein